MMLHEIPPSKFKIVESNGGDKQQRKYLLAAEENGRRN